MNYNTSLNLFDGLILVTVLFSMIISFFRGFFREVLGLFAWVGALVFATNDPQISKSILAKWIESESVLKAVNQLCVFFILLVILLVVAGLLSSILQKIISDNANRILGILFGFMRGLFVVSAFYCVSLYFFPPSKQPPIVSQSKSSSWLDHSAKTLYKILPDSAKKNPNLQESFREMGIDQHVPHPNKEEKNQLIDSGESREQHEKEEVIKEDD